MTLAQILDFSVSQDTVVTLSALYRGQIILDYWGVTLSPSPIVESGWGLHAFTYTIPAGTNLANRFYSPTIKTNGAQISYFAAVKLELGDTQTLAYQDSTGAWQLLPQPESDYATQLAKCQRYFRRFPANYVMGIAQNGNHVSFRYPCNPPMRTTPVLSMQNQSDLTDVIDNGAIPITPSGVVLSWNSNENVVGFFFNDVTDGTGFTCNRYIDASAEL